MLSSGTLARDCTRRRSGPRSRRRWRRPGASPSGGARPRAGGAGPRPRHRRPGTYRGCRGISGTTAPGRARGPTPPGYPGFPWAACLCNPAPPIPHGPYWQWTAKVNGKTVTKRLTDREAHLYQEWIGNDRRIRALLDQIRKVDAKAAELLLKEAVSG